MATHVKPTWLQSDGRYAAAIEMSDGHTVRGEYKYLTHTEAQTAAEEWFERDTAVPEKPTRKNDAKKGAED